MHVAGIKYRYVTVNTRTWGKTHY